jgi:hypothetical protein
MFTAGPDGIRGSTPYHIIELKALTIPSDEMGYPYGHIIKPLILTGQRREEVAGMAVGHCNIYKGRV